MIVLFGKETVLSRRRRSTRREILPARSVWCRSPTARNALRALIHLRVAGRFQRAVAGAEHHAHHARLAKLAGAGDYDIGFFPHHLLGGQRERRCYRCILTDTAPAGTASDIKHDRSTGRFGKR